MKKINLILILCICLFKGTNAQSPVTDTTSYLQSIINNKSQYVGQPFSMLANNLLINIKKFNPIAGVSYNINQETSTAFSFYFPQILDDFNSSFPKLIITWQLPLNATQSRDIYNANNGGNWCLIASSFYSNKIVTDIRLLE